MEGNRIVSLQSNRNPLQEEAGFARIARSGCQPPTQFCQETDPISVYWVEGLYRDGNKV